MFNKKKIPGKWYSLKYATKNEKPACVEQKKNFPKKVFIKLCNENCEKPKKIYFSQKYWAYFQDYCVNLLFHCERRFLFNGESSIEPLIFQFFVLIQFFTMNESVQFWCIIISCEVCTLSSLIVMNVYFHTLVFKKKKKEKIYILWRLQYSDFKIFVL